MKNFDSVVNRIKEIVLGCENNSHDFAVNEGGCYDCTAFPEITYNGDNGSVSDITLKKDGTIILCGTTEWDNFEANIEELSFEDVISILRTLEVQKGLDRFEVVCKEYFPITSLSREDIAELGFKGAENLSDSVMERIARKMADAYLESSFWVDLDIMVSDFTDLKK